MNEELEAEIRRLHDDGDLEGAVTRALRGYGNELFGFLIATERSEEDAAEIFGALSEDIWKGIGGFRWACSFRTWAYTLARHAAYRQRKRRARRGAEVRLSTTMISRIAQDIVTSFGGQRTALDELRDELPEEDRVVLVLRLDKGLSFQDVARVLLGDTNANEDELSRESARVRKRFSLVKRRLVERGRELGLLGE